MTDNKEEHSELPEQHALSTISETESALAVVAEPAAKKPRSRDRGVQESRSSRSGLQQRDTNRGPSSANESEDETMRQARKAAELDEAAMEHAEASRQKT